MNSDIVLIDTFRDDFLDLKKELLEKLERYFKEVKPEIPLALDAR